MLIGRLLGFDMLLDEVFQILASDPGQTGRVTDFESRKLSILDPFMDGLCTGFQNDGHFLDRKELEFLLMPEAWPCWKGLSCWVTSLVPPW